jgi:hypothetical protein
MSRFQSVFCILAVFVLATVASGCGDDGGGGPTDPGGLQVGVTVIILNQNLAGTIQEAELFFDGQRIGSFNTSGGAAPFAGLHGETMAGRGSHQIRLEIKRQVGFSVPYFTDPDGSSVEVLDISSGTSVRTIRLERRSGSLREGEGFTWTVGI